MFTRSLFVGLLIASQVAGLNGSYPEESYNGLTLFVSLTGSFEGEEMSSPFSASIRDVQGSMATTDSSENQNVVLLDPSGEVFHEWRVAYLQKRFVFLNEDGTLAFRANTANQPIQAQEDDPAVLQELSWDSEVLWEWTHPYFHHDMAKLPSGNYLAIIWEELNEESYEALGGDSDVKTIWGDSIVEIDYDSGEIIWEWSLEENIDVADYVFIGDKSVEWSHLNTVEYLPEGNVFNGVESFLISSRHLSTVWLVNMESGEIEWESPEGMMVGQHDPTLLENGNILIFDNGKSRSRVIELDPETNEIVWSYEAEDFFSGHISGAQRLPNGNTLITEGASGHIFEVTEDGDIVWDYEVSGTDNALSKNGAVFRAYRYGLDDIDWPEDALEAITELFESYAIDDSISESELNEEEESDEADGLDDTNIETILDSDEVVVEEEVSEDELLSYLPYAAGGVVFFLLFWGFWYSHAKKEV